MPYKDRVTQQQYNKERMRRVRGNTKVTQGNTAVRPDVRPVRPASQDVRPIAKVMRDSKDVIPNVIPAFHPASKEQALKEHRRVT